MLKVKRGLIRNVPADGCQIRSEWNITSQRCWYVSVVADDGSAAIPMEFARKVDADRAMDSIQDMDSWQGTLAEISTRMHKFTIDELKKRMTENLAW